MLKCQIYFLQYRYILILRAIYFIRHHEAEIHYESLLDSYMYVWQFDSYIWQIDIPGIGMINVQPYYHNK